MIYTFPASGMFHFTLCTVALAFFRFIPAIFFFYISFFSACNDLPSSSATNRLINAKDHAAIQINIGHLDSNGVYRGEFTPLAFCGFIRDNGTMDASLTRLAQKHGFVKSFAN